MRTHVNFKVGIVVLLTSLFLVGSAVAQTETTIHIFTGYTTDGAVGAMPSTPYGGLIADSAGNLYGTTPFGGTSAWCDEEGHLTGCGTVFEEMPPQVKGGPWTEQVLYSFLPNLVGDGIQPKGGLVMDSAGNLYGTTVEGQGSYNSGNIFELSPPIKPGDPWTEVNIYTFHGPGIGYYPNGSLVFDGKGNLYGTTNEGGTNNVGTVFELSPPGQPGGAWTETTLYSFGANRTDGSYPEAGVILDGVGNIYGTTNQGGTSNYGIVYRLIKSSGGIWQEQIIHRFAGTDGAGPSSGLLLSKGALYGTTRAGGPTNGGTIFQIAQVNKKIIETTLYTFATSGPDGSDPRSALVTDSTGNLYGTADIGGGNGNGTAFKLAPPSQPGGQWTYSLLYSFTGGSDGAFPPSPLLLKNGTLYGLTAQGGDQACYSNLAHGCGTVFSVVP